MYTYKRFKTSKSAVSIILIALALVVWSVLGLAGSVLAGKGESKYVYVNATFRDGPDDRIRSDGNGPYKNGEDNVLAGVYKRFRLDTTKGSRSRTVTLDFDGFFGEDPIEVEVDMRLCYKYTEEDAADGVLEEYPYVTEMDVGQEIQATMGIAFSYEGQSYALGFNNPFQWLNEIPEGAEEADPVTLRRISGEEWEIEAPSDAWAILYLVDWKNGNEICGYYHMPFMVSLVKQPKKGRKKAPPAPNLSSGFTSTWGRIKADLQ